MIVEFHPQVAEDFLQAAEFYEACNASLVPALQREFDQVLGKIVANPKLFAEVRGIRRALLTRFPFSVLYRIRDSNTIRVLALRHHKRKQQFAADRE